ncbi:MAG: metallophosphoesterase [Armatimonadetes bacterium]|nr:metallophosphoesterase [Armatimonadota bacterium]
MPIPLVTAALLATSLQSAGDPVTFSFAFFGCDRVDVGDWKKDPTSNPSSANRQEVERSIHDIEAIQPRPKILFLCGDLVANYAHDQGEVLKGQLAAFRQLVDASGAAKLMKVVALPGNHELNQKHDDQKLPNPVTDPIWTEWASAAGYAEFAGNGPKPGDDAEDALLDDQSRLSYSFDTEGLHFLLLNTDTRTTTKDRKTGEGRVAWVPAHWAARDLDKAEHDPAVRSTFVLGHRNLADPDSVAGDSPIDKDCGDVLLAAIHSSSKCKAYLCSHVHAFDAKQIGSAWQFIEGRGGSPFEKGWEPTEGKTFGFTLIEVHASGRIEAVRYSRSADGLGQVNSVADRRWTVSQ